MRDDKEEQIFTVRNRVMDVSFKIIEETDNYIVINKPSGLATQTAGLGERDLVSEVKNYLADKTKKKNPYIAVINRLDQPVEGLVLMAKDEKTAANLSRHLMNGDIKKYYRAEVFGHMINKKGRLEDLIVKEASNISRIADKNDKRAKKAILEYEVINSDENTELLDIYLITGRHHQIRVQLSGAGCPIVGDRKYGNEGSKAYSTINHINNVRLRAYRLVLPNGHDISLENKET